jgi:putative two-component system protein, hydrogenase maturation factor HypX/HoxX
MRILLLVHGFNSLAQRLYVELARDGHELSVELDIHDRVTTEAVDLFGPTVVLAPFLKRAIPESIWQRCPCFIVHPGPPGDRGPSALDWAILRGVDTWAVTVLQAVAEWDAGPVWASASFPMRAARKSSLYHHEVADAAVSAVREALSRFRAGLGPWSGPGGGARDGRQHGWQPLMRQAHRAIDWRCDDAATVLRKIHSADGSPGVEDTLFERRFRLFDARAEARLAGIPGTLIARRHGAVCCATRDGAVWIGQLQSADGSRWSFKRPEALALGPLADTLPTFEEAPPESGGELSDGEIHYHEHGAIGYLHFDFYNGALSTVQCQRLRAAYARARGRPTRVIVLMGGTDFWCNGMHLHCIEAADSPADASWTNINVIDDLAGDILTTDTHLTVSALRGAAAAGGVFLALAADLVLARSAVVLNPHYRNMGNLYGSEYWTYLLPRRVGGDQARAIMERRLPLGAPEARALGMIDDCAGPDLTAFQALVESHATRLANGFSGLLAEKRARRERDEGIQPLLDYRQRELERMRMNFYGFDPSYHIARHRFVHRTPHAWTPLHLAVHRRVKAREPAPA